MKKLITESQFKEEFEDVNVESTFLLSKDDSTKLWEYYIDKNSLSYFSLSDENWIISSSQQIIGQWIDDYNSDNIGGVKELLNNEVLWNENDTILYCISKMLTIETSWSEFKKNWICFLESDDDCPIVINKSENKSALVFVPLGNIIKI